MKKKDKVAKTMHEFKHGALKSRSGRKVTSRKQAIAIGLSQARRAKTSHATIGSNAAADFEAGFAYVLRDYKAGMTWEASVDLATTPRDKRSHAFTSGARAAADALAGWHDEAERKAKHFGVPKSVIERLIKSTSYENLFGKQSGHATRKAAHSTRKSPAQLDKEIAEFMAKPKLGDAAWEGAWSELLTEKHSKARMPTTDEVARALRYIENEYTLKEGTIDGEQWAEGLAFGRYAGDAEDKVRAKAVLKQLSAAKWLRLAERANRLSLEQNENQRYLA